MPASVSQQANLLAIPADQRAMYTLLLEVQKDLVALRSTLNTHVHTANNTVLTTPAAALNTTV